MCLSEVRKASGDGQAYKVILQYKQDMLSVWVHQTEQQEYRRVIFNKEEWNEAKLNKISKGGYTSGFHCFSNLEDAQCYVDWLKKFKFPETSEVWEVEYQEKTFTGYETVADDKLDAIVANKIKFIRKVT